LPRWSRRRAWVFRFMCVSERHGMPFTEVVACTQKPAAPDSTFIEMICHEIFLVMRGRPGDLRG
jgi:hypothetical protein